MAQFEVEGLEALEDFFGNMAAIPDEVIDKMLNAEADIAVNAQKRTASSMLNGPYNKGAVSGAVKKSKVKGTKSGKAINITFPGKQHGNRIGEIAFVNEYGKQGQNPRPFIKTANEECADTAVEAAGAIFDEFINSI